MLKMDLSEPNLTINTPSEKEINNPYLKLVSESMLVNTIFEGLVKEFLSETCKDKKNLFTPDYPFNPEHPSFEHWLIFKGDNDSQKLFQGLNTRLEFHSDSQSKNLIEMTFYNEAAKPPLPKDTMLFFIILQNIYHGLIEKIYKRYNSQDFKAFLTNVRVLYPKLCKVNIVIIYQEAKKKADFNEMTKTFQPFNFYENDQDKTKSFEVGVVGLAKFNMDEMYKHITGLADTASLTLLNTFLKYKNQVEQLSELEGASTVLKKRQLAKVFE